MLSDKEKLEGELRFFKESFDIGVITEEEYEIGRQKVESKLKKLDEDQETKVEALEDIQIKEIKQEDTEIKVGDNKEESQLEPEEEKPKEKEELDEIKEEEIQLETSTGEEIKEQEVPREGEVEGAEVKSEQKTEEEIKKEGEDINPEVTIKEEPFREEKIEESAKKEEIVDVEEEKILDELEEQKTEEDILIQEVEERVKEEPPITLEDKKTNKKIFAYITAILIISLGSWFFFFEGKSDIVGIPVDESFSAIVGDTTLFIACSSDKDCIKEGKIGICSNPGTGNAECNYIDDVSIKLTVLNSKDCFNCKTGRILSILKNFYPNLYLEKVNFETEEGKEIAEKFGIDVLPGYIFDSNFAEAYNYNKLSNAFKEVKSSFVMKNVVANANYYFEREEIPNKLDLFLQQGQEASSKAEENLKEFLDAFDGKVVFEKHYANDKIVKDLGINTFPTFLISNKIKFSGVQPADKIRENFCQLNKVAECALGFSKSLV